MLNSILSSFLFFAFNFHAFYISVTEIVFNPKDKTVEVCSHIFTSDLESAFKAKNKKMIDLSLATNKAVADKFLSDYLKEKIKITVNGKSMTLNYYGYEINEDAVWIYADIKNISAIKSINVTNTILYDLIETQSNMLQVVVGSNKQNAKLDYPKKEVVFNF
jgi:hypothetical protein